MTVLATLSLREVLNRVAAPTPTPGGGTVSAITGALGAALAEMVASLPRTRGNAAAEREALDRARPAIAAARARLETLADLDTAAFDRLLGALRRPKSTDAEKTERHLAVVHATKEATLVPIEIVRVCADVLKLMETVAESGHRAAASDLLVGIGLTRVAAEGAAASARANLRTLDDPAFVVTATRRLDAALADVTQSVPAALGTLQP